MGRRRRAPAGGDVQYLDRLGGALSAGGLAEGTALVARPALHGHRARSAQPADDHQGGAAHAAAPRGRTGDAARGRGRHRRGGRAAQSHRQRGARLRAADSVRARAGGSQRALPRVRGGGPGDAGRPGAARSRPVARRRDHRRRAAARRAGQSDRERTTCRRAAGAGRGRGRRVPGRRVRRRASRIRVPDPGGGRRLDHTTGVGHHPPGRGASHDRRRRWRRRDRSGRPAACLRSLLHDEEGRHRSRPPDRQEHHRRSRRLSRRGERAGPRDRDSVRSSIHAARPLMPRRGSLLLVDDEEKILKTLGRALRDAGHEVVETTSPREARRLLGERPIDVCIIDNVMPERGGLDVIREYVGSTPEGERAQILMMTAHATIESALAAMKLGALDYLQKPFEIDELLVVVDRALDHQRLRTEYRYLRSERDEQFDHYGIIGRSRVMQEIIRRAERVADTKSTVLITGETGTGKELVARAIHNRSPQRDMPLIKVNCAAIPESLLESELFGHVRGAFTGATTTKKGKFALADGGSIFLDEIGTMSLTVQSKLLRVLQEREFEPLGAERTEKVDVRVIAATNRDLRQLVVDGKFQEDLFYRLNVIPIELPPLRDRRDDIPALVDHFVRKHAQRTGRPVERIDDGVLAALQQYDWPGNVRELENTIERAVVLSTGPAITARSISVLAAAARQTTGLPSLKLRQNIEWVERETIRRALESSRGVKKDAAELMGISQRALSYYLAKYRLD